MSSASGIVYASVDAAGNLTQASIDNNYFTFTNSGGWIFLCASAVVLLFVILCIMNAYQYFKIEENSKNVDFIDEGQANAYAIINCILGAIFVFFAVYLIYKTLTVKTSAMEATKIALTDINKIVEERKKVLEQKRTYAQEEAERQVASASLSEGDKVIYDMYEKEKKEDQINSLGSDIYTLERERDNLQQQLIRNRNNLKNLEENIPSNNTLERERIVDQVRELQILVDTQQVSLDKKGKDILDKKYQINEIKSGAKAAAVEQAAYLALQEKYTNISGKKDIDIIKNANKLAKIQKLDPSGYEREYNYYRNTLNQDQKDTFDDEFTKAQKIFNSLTGKRTEIVINKEGQTNTGETFSTDVGYNLQQIINESNKLSNDEDKGKFLAAEVSKYENNKDAQKLQQKIREYIQKNYGNVKTDINTPFGRGYTSIRPDVAAQVQQQQQAQTQQNPNAFTSGPTNTGMGSGVRLPPLMAGKAISKSAAKGGRGTTKGGRGGVNFAVNTT